MVNRLATASRIELHSALRLPCRLYTQVPPYFVEGHTLQKVKIVPIFLRRKCETTGSKIFQGQTYVKASVVPSIKKNPYRVVVEFSPQNDILRAACTCPAGLGLSGKGKCNHVGGALFAIEDFARRGLQKHAEPLSCTSRLSVWVVPFAIVIAVITAVNGILFPSFFRSRSRSILVGITAVHYQKLSRKNRTKAKKKQR